MGLGLARCRVLGFRALGLGFQVLGVGLRRCRAEWGLGFQVLGVGYSKVSEGQSVAHLG